MICLHAWRCWSKSVASQCKTAVTLTEKWVLPKHISARISHFHALQWGAGISVYGHADLNHINMELEALLEASDNKRDSEWAVPPVSIHAWLLAMTSYCWRVSPHSRQTVTSSLQETSAAAAFPGSTVIFTKHMVGGDKSQITLLNFMGM